MAGVSNWKERFVVARYIVWAGMNFKGDPRIYFSIFRQDAVWANKAGGIEDGPRVFWVFF
ncbi:MAG: hypothetical protein CM1200mP25_2460 [Acidobacteriota bacterium]|nr:MAG: hypothetical protein CM1200mP25_2460 [Acidobacteriota bacterium]